MTRWILASSNPGKVREFRALLGARIELLALPDGFVLPDETGATFEANAILKAEFTSRHLGATVLADDSGLEVDALGGAPGVRSARFAPGSDQDRVQAVLRALGDRPDRSARFVCALALAAPGQATRIARGTVSGTLARTPRGTQGFGYDPIFVPEGETRHMAELSLEEKAARSHRARAVHALCTAREAPLFA